MKLKRYFIAIAMTAAAAAAASEPPDPETGLTAAAVDASGIELPQVGPAAGDEFIPMTRSERLRFYLKGTFGAGPLARTALHAETGQWMRNPKEWGGGPAGFTHRLGSAFAQHFVRQTLQSGLSMALHEDTRYRRARRGGAWKRVEHAVAGTFLARRDNGRRGFSYAGIGSAAGASFISRAWMPRTAATLGAGASSFGISIGMSMGWNLFREFWPDLKRRFRRH